MYNDREYENSATTKATIVGRNRDECLDKLFEKDTCTPVFTTTQITIVKTWKQPKYPSTNEWIKKM